MNDEEDHIENAFPRPRVMLCSGSSSRRWHTCTTHKPNITIIGCISCGKGAGTTNQSQARANLGRQAAGQTARPARPGPAAPPHDEAHHGAWGAWGAWLLVGRCGET